MKRLTPHQIDPSVSHGHEFQGSRTLQDLFGSEELRGVPCLYFWLPDGDDDELVRIDSKISWYDSRKNQPHRAPEWRLYYSGVAEEIVHRRAQPDDLAVLAWGLDGTIYVLIAAAGSHWESKLLALLDLPPGGTMAFEVRAVDENAEIGLAEELLLEALGLTVPVPADTRSEQVAENLYRKFDGRLPPTREFSRAARETFEGPALRDDPDGALVGLIEWETRLFKLFEARIVGPRLVEGFLRPDASPDVEGFFRFAKSCGQSRFSRAGQAFQHHVAEILAAFGVKFDAQAKTEGGKTPDFLFPGAVYYHDVAFAADRLRMLGVKTSGKDRWRQLVTEADRIQWKHYLTLESPISPAQTAEMHASKVRLVIPAGQHVLFTESQRASLLSFRAFIHEVLEEQARLEREGVL